jgi:hypothetical protein
MSPTLDDQIMHGRLAARANLEMFKSSIGSTGALESKHLIDDAQTQSSTKDDMSESDSDEEDDQTLDDLSESITHGKIDLDKIMVSAADAGRSKGVDPAHCLRSGKSI